MEVTDKSTHESKVELFQALMKDSDGKYMAVLSDTSTDRDGEIVGKEALNKIKSDSGFVSILLNHENKIQNLVGEWINRRLVEQDGHTALIAEPKFFMSNPNAKMIKGMLDDGAKCGISIGAIVKDSDMRKINGVDTKVFTDVELLEASFVAIPSNRHGVAMAVAKSFKDKLEGHKMSDEKTYSEKEYKELEEVNTTAEKKVTEVSKELEGANLEIEKLKAELTIKNDDAAKDDAKAKDDADAKDDAAADADKAESDKKFKEMDDKIEATNKELKALKSSPLFKGDFNGSDGADKGIKDTELPIMRK